ncbi:major facilitator superfamily domain-containing protein [Elsinoe ampelina]|uniref:Major facilitator superfamily domain-containing protein n=1 Tax=Elsinoe ampelina TaxID=302913 RepID=A0A6A6GEU1_9PEZI|nr:major facilitator superfamily domain-containing protein [Elsinoe ampelina]
MSPRLFALRRKDSEEKGNSRTTSLSEVEGQVEKRQKWTLGVLSDKETDEVPGSILLMPKVSEFNEPLGLQNTPARVSSSSLPSSPYPPSSRRSSVQRKRSIVPEKKRTADGTIILEPQPDDSLNDPLNWKIWRRDAALLSLGLYCMVGGGMTPILAAGFNDVAADYGVTNARVALTTGLYMMGMGVGSAFLSPTAILYGKRPVYLVSAVCFILSAIWCALSPNFISLAIARIFQGFAVSAVECLPSASVAEIYFLHEKAYRLGIYTLLLLGGKNLVPLVSAVVINSLGWRWVFWIVAMVVGFCLALLFFFVPETFWDRTPRPHKSHNHRLPLRKSLSRMSSFVGSPTAHRKKPASPAMDKVKDAQEGDTIAARRAADRHAHFAEAPAELPAGDAINDTTSGDAAPAPTATPRTPPTAHHTDDPGYFAHSDTTTPVDAPDEKSSAPATPSHIAFDNVASPNPYTSQLQREEPKTFVEQLVPYSGRLRKDSWLRVFVRPFILFAYPSILWSTLVYSLSIGWLIVLSESVTDIYKSRNTYNFTSLQAGLVYISPFIGGVLGTAVAGKVSDVIVRWMSRRNGGVYEPEFRLVMAIPIAITTVIGLMGYGWSAEERDAWIVPTVFFGFISFGCSLGSTTSITFAVDSYRQYAGEALVTLNFSKNIFHGLVFSLFFNHWLEHDGSKKVFIAIGAIQMACMFFTIPMYIFGKRARMWTVRKNLMEKF